MSNYRIPGVLKQELEKHEDWEIVRGKRHMHIRIKGHLAGILPFTVNEGDRRAMKNIISQVRRKRQEVMA